MTRRPYFIPDFAEPTEAGPPSALPVDLPHDLRRCASDQCIYLVAGSALYCCGPCAAAWEATPRYEPHSHSTGCLRRQADRVGRPL